MTKNKKLTRFTTALASFSLIFILFANGFENVDALSVGAGTQQSTATQTSLNEVAGATDIASLMTAVQTFLTQYGNITFSTTCPTADSSVSCASLSDSDVAGSLASARVLATEFVEEWSKYPLAWVQASQPATVYFLKQVAVTGQHRAAVPDNAINAMLYDIGYSGSLNDANSQEYMREVIHHEYDHFIEDIHTGQPGSAPDPTWASYNPPGFSYGSGGASCYSGSCPSGPHVVQGFATGYATSAIEEDKAETYAYLFDTADYNSIQTWIQTDTYLAKKVANTEAFIQSIVPSMNQQYFTSIHTYYEQTHGMTGANSANQVTLPAGSNISQQTSLATGTSGQFTASFAGSANNSQLIVFTGSSQGSDGLPSGVQYPIAEATFNLANGAVDASGVVLQSNHATYQALAHNLGSLTTTGNYTLFVPYKTGDNAVGVCPGVSSLNNVNASCPNLYYLANGQTANGATATLVTVAGMQYWQVAGLTSTGGFSTSEAATPASSTSPAASASATVPKTPDTGFALVAAHPLTLLASSTIGASILFFAARRFRISTQR